MSKRRPLESVGCVNRNALRSPSGMPPRYCQRTSGCISVSLLIGSSITCRKPARPIGRDRLELVEIAPALLRIGGFQPLLVGDRLLLHELDRHGAALPIVEIEQALGFAAHEDAGELVGEIDRIL